MDGLAPQLEGKLGSVETIVLFDRPSATVAVTFRCAVSIEVMGRGMAL